MPGLRRVGGARTTQYSDRGAVPCSVSAALFLRHHAEDATLVAPGGVLDAPPGILDRLDRAGIGIKPRRVRRIAAGVRSGVVFQRNGFAELAYDVTLSGLGVDPQTVLAPGLGVDCDDEGRILTDSRQGTSRPMVWAAGDAVTGLNQIAGAIAPAKIAATGFHNEMRRREVLSIQP